MDSRSDFIRCTHRKRVVVRVRRKHVRNSFGKRLLESTGVIPVLIRQMSTFQKYSQFFESPKNLLLRSSRPERSGSRSPQMSRLAACQQSPCHERGSFEPPSELSPSATRRCADAQRKKRNYETIRSSCVLTRLHGRSVISLTKGCTVSEREWKRGEAQMSNMTSK